MAYLGRGLDRGNYLKLDDISSQFNGSSVTFNLTSGGQVFYPGSSYALLVSLAGVVQEPESAYTIDQNQITFATAPQSNDDYFCVVSGISIGIGVPSDGTVDSSKLQENSVTLSKIHPDAISDLKTGISTAGGLTGSPSITVTDITASGNVSIAGTLTYEDVTNIDSIGIVTARSGIHVTGGSVGIGTTNPAEALEVYGDARFKAPDGSHGIELFSDIGSLGYQRIISWNRTTSAYENLSIGANDLIIGPNVERLRITSAGLVGISSTEPKTDVDISQKTGAVALPQGTTAQRPTGSAPYIRKNSTNNALEFYNGTNWVEIITDYFPTGSTTLG